jgi:DNA-binding NtrC family response regulator
LPRPAWTSRRASLPPLRERRDDLGLLVERLLDDIGLRLGHPIEIDAAALQVLAQHSWPGNVRELGNVLERALLRHETQRLTADQIASVLPAAASVAPAPPVAAEAAASGAVESLATAIAAAERQSISAALHATGGNKVAAAQALGISRTALYQKLAALGLR